MARKIIDTGVVGNDGTGDSIRDSFRKVNDNFRELYSSLGLGDKLTFAALDDLRPNRDDGSWSTIQGSPESAYIGQEGAVISVNSDESGVTFKQLAEGVGITIDNTNSEITISSKFSSIAGDPNPQLGGDLRSRSGGVQHRILELPPYNFNSATPGGPTSPDEAVSKAYADTKISRAGVNGIDPETGQPNATYGVMTGPLILSRNPEPDDDSIYGGLIAATKSYVDNAGFGSVANLYVATSGSDDRVGVSRELQGRALPYAYRTLEAALKRAEEIINESRLEIGPYKKVLTYNNGANQCTLERIDTASTPSIPFSGIPLMSITTATLIPPGGINYNIGDIITVVGGTFEESAKFQVLSTAATPGGVVTFKTISTGVYSALPGTIVGDKRIVTTTATNSLGGTTFGAGVQFSVGFSVNNIEVLDEGAGYGLVSARVVGGGGTGAFGTADVVGGEIKSITVTDGGSGFINLPTVRVDLPRFLIKTEGQRTDFTGDLTDTATAARTRDIREGLFLRGETSGALAQILAHSGDLDEDGNEIFDIDLIYGIFQDAEEFGTGEVISYGDVARQTQITILVESGIYEENYPLRVPPNTSIVGDEFRRVIIRPKFGISSSPWAFLYFRRDISIGSEAAVQSEFIPFEDGVRVNRWQYEPLDGDLLTVTGPNVYGYHYLQNTTEPVYPLINNKGFYRSAAKLLELNRTFLQQQVVNWISDQIENDITPFTSSFTYDRDLFQRDIGSLVDSLVFDLRYGDSNRTISSALKYKERVVQVNETVAGIERLNTLAQLIVKNITITELYGSAFVPQIVDRAYRAEIGTYGSSIDILSISNDEPLVIETVSAHGLSNGDEILINGILGTTELNGNNFYVEIVNSTQFGISETKDRAVLVNGEDLGVYVSGGSITTPGGVIGSLINAVIDIVDTTSESYNLPKNNDQMDVFLANDTVRWQGISGQGHGGFMLVLDPYGQILAKSPYAQECASFSKSIDRQTFAGGMFVDGFAGNIRFKLLEVDSPTFLRVGGLTRRPQLPASFIVNDSIYRINYVRDFTFSTEGSTASFILDETTPWTFGVIDFNYEIFNNYIEFIIDGLGYDIVLETNYHSRKAGLNYRESNIIELDQIDITARGVTQAHARAGLVLSDFGLTSQVTTKGTIVTTIIRNGQTFAPNLSFTNPLGVSADIVNAKSILQANISFIQNESIGWIDAQISGDTAPFTSSFTYNVSTYFRDIGYIVEATIYDILYGGNSQTRNSARKFYDGGDGVVEWQLTEGSEEETAAAINYVKYLAKQVVQNLAPASTYSSTTRISGTPASATEVSRIEDLISDISDVIINGVGSLPVEVLPDLDAYGYSSALKNARLELLEEKSVIQSETIDFVEDNINVFEVLMPGNRSMLSNDFTQINDMGYGLFVTNGGLAEAVSMFTYYNYISYYSLNGGQIRSVSGSSAHGLYALVAQGADPLEVPTPVNLYHDLSQGATCYFPSALYANTAGGVTLFVTDYTYLPLFNSELEIEFDNLLFRYSITSVATADLPPGVARLNLTASDGEGLEDIVPDGTPLTIRQGAQTVLTGDVVEVATRPSTGLVLRESNDVYRILQFSDYSDPVGLVECTISNSDPVIITKSDHELNANYQIVFSTTGELPTGLEEDTPYFVLPDNLSTNNFQISATKNGVPIATTSAGSGTHSYEIFGLARTTLRENYNYVDITIYSTQPFTETLQTCTVSSGDSSAVTVTTDVAHGYSLGDVIRFDISAGGEYPSGISPSRHYFVHSIESPTEFQISLDIGPSATPTEISSVGSGTLSIGLVSGKLGDSEFAVIAIGPEESRILQSKFVFLGEEYTVTGYDNESVTGTPYALLRITPPLVNSVLAFNSLPTLKSGVPKGEPGTLTIRISLTRATGHDLLEIGTGSYADTNYPNELYGPSVNSLSPSDETQERGVGRVFYVTTDQFGNFSVGPYFRVDQGTGTVTFSAAIALSNLDGLGFKRGVPISEFSTDNSFADNASDSVPTENATRIYIERRLGVTHTGAVVPEGSLIPPVSGGFMPLSGLLPMKDDMNLGNFKITNVSNPVDPTDAVNLQSLTWDNFQDQDFAEIAASDVLAFTGVGNTVQNSTMIGDIALTVDADNRTINAQIVAGAILNADVNSSAAIAQSKLAMTKANTFDEDSATTGWSGSNPKSQADLGLAKFSDENFEVTEGYVRLKSNGVVLGEIQTLPADTVVGNSTGIAATPTAVTFATVVDEGLAIKKSNYNALGFLRRKNGTSFTGDTGVGLTDSYEVIDADSSNTANALVRRDVNGDFASRNINVSRLLVDSKPVLDSTTSGGGGVIQVYGFLGQAAILLGDGSLSTDKTNFYDNERHIFRPQNGIGNAPITCSTITASAITGSGSPTTMTGTFRLASGSTLHATYADLAEYYEADTEYAVGTVLVFGGEKEVTLSNKQGDHRVAGVVSDQAAYIMNVDCPGLKTLIALQGRVPCRVVGKIQKGDLMITSRIAGVAVSAEGDAKAGTIIGKALENYDSDHIGTIEVAVGRT